MVASAINRATAINCVLIIDFLNPYLFLTNGTINEENATIKLVKPPIKANSAESILKV